jgi:hypothetical protein
MRVISLLCAVLYGHIQGQCRPRSSADSSMRTTGACGAPNVNVMAVPLPSGDGDADGSGQGFVVEGMITKTLLHNW